MSIISEIQIVSDIILRYKISITNDDFFAFGIVSRDWDRNDWIYFQAHKPLFRSVLVGRDIATNDNHDDDIKSTDYDFFRNEADNLKDTDLDRLKEVAISLLYVDIEETPLSPMIVQHPVFESGIYFVNNDGDFVNLLTDSEGLVQARKNIESLIRKARNPIHVYLTIRKSYRLAFLRFARPYLSQKDFSELLADAWVTSENPNDDVNVPISMLIKWFRKADKKALMVDDDFKVYSELPQEFRIYRGVSVGRVEKGLSWTCNLSTAEWFRKRFEEDKDEGYILTALVNKDDVLAYFNTRGEDEIVADVSKLDIEPFA